MWSKIFLPSKIASISKQVTIALLLLLLLSPLNKVFAESVQLTAKVGDTVLQIKGFAPPNVLITFLNGNVVKGTTTSDANGLFDKIFTAQDGGLQNIKIYYSDIDFNLSNTVELALFLIDFQTLLVEDVYLPPTLSVEKNSYNAGEQIVISGYAIPNSLIEIEVNGNTGRFTVVSTDANGFYSAVFQVNDFLPGDYVALAKVKTNLSINTNISNDVAFTIFGSGGGNLIFVPIKYEQTCIYPFKKLCIFDKEGKGYLDQSTDVPNILLGFVEFYNVFTDNSFDINEDGIVSAFDVSIVLYYTRSPRYQVLGIDSNYDNSVLAEADITVSDTGRVLSSHQTDLIEFVLRLVIPQLLLGGVFLTIFLFLIFVLRKDERDKRSNHN